MTPKRFSVPGIGAGLIIGASQDETVPDVDPEAELRKREIEKLAFPPWIADSKAESTVAPVLAFFTRTLAAEELGTDLTELPRLRALVDRMEGTKLADKRKLSGKELKRLLVLADFIGRKFMPNAMTFVGGAPVARMLRDRSPVRTAGDVHSLSEVFDALASNTVRAVDPSDVTEDQFLLINAVSFAGLYLKGLIQLLRLIQETLLDASPAAAPSAGMTIPTTGSPAAEAKVQGDVMEVDGQMIYDLIQYAFSVYGAARVLASRSVGGKGAKIEVDRMGLACLGEMLAV